MAAAAGLPLVPPEQRNVYGQVARHPDLAQTGIRLRQFGQEIIEILGGKRFIRPGQCRVACAAR